MLNRIELDYLRKWLHRSNRKPLVLRGARQVGKSTLVQLLAEQESLNLITFDFEKDLDCAQFFQSKDPKVILELLSTKFKQKIVPANTLLFLDEIQKMPEVIGTLRYFYEQMPGLAVIAAGSLLDLALSKINFSMPVGRIEYLYLNPMSFEAFLYVTKQQQLLEYLKQYSFAEPMPSVIHQQALNCVKNYFIVGGMPEAVAEYCASEDYIEVDRIKKSLLTTYIEDFAKYATAAEQARLRLVFNKIPRMLGEKFKYSKIDPDQKTAVIKTAVEQLSLARIINVVYHTDANGLPLGAEMNDKTFKTYFLDIGLIASQLDLNLLNLDLNNLNLINSGKIAEQFVAQELLQLRELYEPPVLYYWLREQKSASAEIDFVIPFNGSVLPIEVKAGKTGTLKSLHYFMDIKKLPIAVRFCDLPPSITNVTVKVQSELVVFKLLTLPFYLIGQMRRLMIT